MANKNLTNAKNAKNDEFYTQYHDIEKEVSAYLEFNPEVFRGKTILLPCDDPEWSNFTKFFAQNFQRFGLKKLISTSYVPDSKKYQSDYQPTLFEKKRSAIRQRQKNQKRQQKQNISNCPLCALGHDANKTKIWKLTEMDADHVAAWSKGGATDIKNCEMLCKTHNRAKGNK